MLRDPNTADASSGSSVPAQPGKDAVCFTAGANGVAFGAGVIHAYLASNRPAPAVAAGISTGALNAAAMQRCYQEMKQAGDGDAQEIARWNWFRRYLDLLTNDPMSVIWDGLPNQSDFYADVPPVKDPTPPLFKDQEAKKDFERREFEARKELYLFVKGGNWLARLPLKIGRIADLMVARIRAKEEYSQSKIGRQLAYLWELLVVLLAMLFHVVFCPQWFPEYKFNKQGWHRYEWRRPLLGWRVWSLATLVFCVPAFAAAVNLYFLVSWIRSSSIQKMRVDVVTAWSGFIQLLRDNVVLGIALFGVLAFLVVTIRLVKHWIEQSNDWGYRWNAVKHFLSRLGRQEFLKEKGKSTSLSVRLASKYVFRSLALESHLVHDFHIRIRLIRLFGVDGVSPKVTYDPMAVVLVAAPLQKLKFSAVDGQLWSTEGTPLVDALFASVARPGLFSPLKVTGDAVQHWIKHLGPGNGELEELDLVDGAVIRKNPLPALFMFLKRHPPIAEQLASSYHDRRVHVIHNHPIASARVGANARDIVDVGSLAWRLQERRDTELEVLQTNFTSQLEEEIRTRTRAKSSDVRSIYADEISPESDISFKNPLSPERQEVLKVVAHGCRKTMETLYRGDIENLAGPKNCLRCRDLTAAISADDTSTPTGLSEVCGACTGILQPAPTKERRSCARPAGNLVEKFPMLTGKEPRIIFVASGGVFRGPFHAGMLACMLATQIRPQMIVGASVGTLMGGALGALLSVPRYDDALLLLGNIIDVFMHVDERIAFTKPFKSATRELGIRGRAIRLSPADLRRMIRKGSRSDPSFAAVGAPAALIDAISELSMIPHRQTSRIAAQFVAGQVTTAMNTLLRQLKNSTLSRLGIETSVIGVSLLEPTARTLLGESMGIRLDTQQPFHNIAFFGTTSDIGQETCVILGRHEVKPSGSYDFVQAALASSAFPCVFAPRPESDIFPGCGSTEKQFSDGGMFDNLPFFPAIEVLADVQREYSQKANLDSIEFLRQRHASPDLFIVGSLDIRAEEDESRYGPFDNLVAITKRAKLLKNNMKIRAFEDSSNRVHEQVERLLDPASDYRSPSDPAFLDEIVDAGTLAVFPSDADHLNPTFAFCRSTGFKPWRVRKSIADGCFQTFVKLIESPTQQESGILRDAIAGLIEKRIPNIAWQPVDEKTKPGQCPYFRHSANVAPSQQDGKLYVKAEVTSFDCPFFQAWQKLSERSDDSTSESAASALAIYEECIADSSHLAKKTEGGNLRSVLKKNLARVEELTKGSLEEPSEVPVATK